jgi:hypothetical protein
VAGRKSGKTPGRNLPTRTVVNLRKSLVVIKQFISNLLRVHFFYTDIRRATKYNLKIYAYWRPTAAWWIGSNMEQISKVEEKPYTSALNIWPVNKKITVLDGDSSIGLSNWPASLCSLAGRYDNPMLELWRRHTQPNSKASSWELYNLFEYTCGG